jgi:transposase InsO family protein
MCRVFGISRSAYYAWRDRKPSKRVLENNVLMTLIREMHTRAKSRLGSPKLTMELRDRGLLVSRPRVARLMNQIGIRSIISKKFKVVTTDSNHDHQPSENLLDRDFTASRPAEKWVSDITYVRTKQGWLYLTIIMDLFDRKIIGWSMSRTLEAIKTVIPAFMMAIRRRPWGRFAELIFHSDRGVQYACDEFRKLLKGLRIK